MIRSDLHINNHTNFCGGVSLDSLTFFQISQISSELMTGVTDLWSKKSATNMFITSDCATTCQLKSRHSRHSPAIFLNPSTHLPPAERTG